MKSVYLSASAQEKNVGIDGVTEETRMQALVKDISARLTAKKLTIYLNNPDWNLSQIIKDSNYKKPNLHIAFHSNSSGKVSGGTGIETWCYGTATDSAKFGRKLQDAVVAVLGLPDRGIKDATIARNIGEVLNTSATAVLIELFFHDNARDVTRFNERRESLIEAIVKVICEWFGIESTAPVVTPNKVSISIGAAMLEGVMINEVVYAPVRSMLEQLRWTVAWDDANKRVIIK